MISLCIDWVIHNGNCARQKLCTLCLVTNWTSISEWQYQCWNTINIFSPMPGKLLMMGSPPIYLASTNGRSIDSGNLLKWLFVCAEKKYRLTLRPCFLLHKISQNSSSIRIPKWLLVAVKLVTGTSSVKKEIGPKKTRPFQFICYTQGRLQPRVVRFVTLCSI